MDTLAPEEWTKLGLGQIESILYPRGPTGFSRGNPCNRRATGYTWKSLAYNGLPLRSPWAAENQVHWWCIYGANDKLGLGQIESILYPDREVSCIYRCNGIGTIAEVDLFWCPLATWMGYSMQKRQCKIFGRANTKRQSFQFLLPLNKPQNLRPAFRNGENKQAPTIDEYIRYCDVACTPIVDPRAWWLEQKTTYPALAVMALDILSIPAMEAEPERLFSSAEATMTDKRNQMKAETLEALESLKSWLGGHSTAWLDSW